MVLHAARLAAGQIFGRDFRSVLWKSLALTIALLIVVWIVVEALVSSLLTPVLGPWPWIATGILWALGAGMFIGAGFLIGPVAALFAGIFLDDIAERVERRHYPSDPPGTPMPLLPGLWLTARFTIVVIAANLLALALILLPGVNIAIFFLTNAYLLGREYFQFASLRFRSETEAGELRRRHGLEIFLAGLVIAGFMAVPVLNLATPLFATALMVHLHKAISQDENRVNAVFARDS